MPYPTVKGTQRQSTDRPNSPTHCEGNTAPVYWRTQFPNPLWREHSAILLTAPIPHPTVKGTQRQSTDSPNSPPHWREHSASLPTDPIPQPTVKGTQRQSTDSLYSSTHCEEKTAPVYSRARSSCPRGPGSAGRWPWSLADPIPPRSTCRACPLASAAACSAHHSTRPQTCCWRVSGRGCPAETESPIPITAAVLKRVPGWQ